MTFRSRLLKLHPAALVLASFLAAIGVGTLALMLPVSTRSGHLGWIDAIFTATSAVCVTGLTVVDTGTYFTVTGQCVILALIQTGGLGLMTISVLLFQWIGRSISIRHRMALQDLFAHTPRADIFRLVRHIILWTLVAEAVGGLLLTLHGSRTMPLGQAAYTAVFHSVSAFCNAGFALFPDSMLRYADDLLLNATVCGLIVVGGIGFPVLYDLLQRFATRGRKRSRLSVQTKTALSTTLILIVVGASLFVFLESPPRRDAASLWASALTPVFQSITCRTAGFNTVEIAGLQDATLAMMMFLMFFGASPGSCGGGVKTTTLALLAAFTLSRLRRRRRVDLFKKSIPSETVTRSVSLVLVSIVLVGLVFFLLLAGNSFAGGPPGETRRIFLSFLFETVSAFGTVGLSMGITPGLNLWGKCWIILTMIIGRVGVLTFSYIVVGNGVSNGVEHAEENLMVG